MEKNNPGRLRTIGRNISDFTKGYFGICRYSIYNTCDEFMAIGCAQVASATFQPRTSQEFCDLALEMQTPEFRQSRDDRIPNNLAGLAGALSACATAVGAVGAGIYGIINYCM